MLIQHNISLKPFNTFGIAAEGVDFIVVDDMAILAEIGNIPRDKFILGGGSNILITHDPEGLVLHNKLKGIELIREDDTHVWLRAASGEGWHDLVMYTVDKGWGGIENLSLIPGTVGASPMQNIGAYGVEARDTIETVTFWHWEEERLLTYSNEECRFGYRDSIFKHHLKNKVFITAVAYKLSKLPVFNTSYGAIEQELQQMGAQPDVRTISQAVINIRRGKLPDPAVIGNAGSFFKNPTIPTAQFEALKFEHSTIPSYPVSDTTVKVPAGWLIEQCGWKGYRNGDVGVHAKQALVLVNYGNAQGDAIWQLSGDVVDSVKRKFGIELEREVQVW